jgi:hypothetical protein
LEQAPRVGFDVLIAAAPTPFVRAEASALKNAAAVIASRFPDAEALYSMRGWRLPESIGRVYDSSRAERVLGFRCRTDFAAVLNALETGAPLPFAHDASYVSPSTLAVEK